MNHHISWLTMLIVGIAMLLLPSLSARLAIFSRIGPFFIAVALILLVVALLR